VQDPSARLQVSEILHGAWTAQVVSTVARLDICERIHENGPCTALELVEEHGVPVQPMLLQRLLRAAASIGVLSEDPDGRFGPTPLSEVLVGDAPGSLKQFAALYGSDWWQSWSRLLDVVRDGQPVPKPWSTDDLERVVQFARSMRSRVVGMRDLLGKIDLAGSEMLVDVGGGFGHVAAELLRLNPGLRARVLDLPAVVEAAQSEQEDVAGDVRARMEWIPGDMFAELPDGDVYLLSGVIHDWDDESSMAILAACAARMGDQGRLFCIDALLPPLGDPSGRPAKLLDLHMMVSLPGKERTESEWRELYRSAGLELTRIVTAPRGASALEGRRLR